MKTGEKTSELAAKEQRLREMLTGNWTTLTGSDPHLIDESRMRACAFAQATEGIAVISDYPNNVCHIYSGRFGQEFFGLPPYLFDNSSAFEDAIFQRVVKEDLLERHVLELRFLTFLKTISADKQTEYQASCAMRVPTSDGKEIRILHTTRPLCCQSSGAALCGICTYIPIPQSHDGAIGSGIVNIATGEAIRRELYEECSSNILSRRQIDVLTLLAQGLASKQIAEKLFISQNTVNRHRQDILSALRVNNTASAVETALRMHLL